MFHTSQTNISRNPMDNLYTHFYTNSAGQKRQYGIFAPGIDRFILVDSTDFWLTMQTAEIVSAKLPTVVFILPPGNEMTNENCLDYTLFNKTQQKVGPSAMSVGRQNPMLKFLFDHDTISYAGVPEDFVNNTDILKIMYDYTQYVHRCVYAINLTDAIYNSRNTTQFTNYYKFDEALTNKTDLSKTENGIFFEMRQILYLADHIAEAEQKIVELWKTASVDQVHLMTGYYRLLNQPIPDELTACITTPSNISTFLF